MKKQKPPHKPDLSNVRLVKMPAKSPQDVFAREVLRIHDKYIWPVIRALDDDTDTESVIQALLTGAMMICMGLRHDTPDAEQFFVQSAAKVLARMNDGPVPAVMEPTVN
jgi:hypothetical protein